ncbi:MAG: HU family DNA-binding protein [Planctomycetota bacterium]
MSGDEKSITRTITKKDLIDRIADQTGETRVTAKNIVQHFLDEIVHELGEGNRLEFRDFGVFEIKSRQARVAQNPRTLERVSVPAKNTIKFKPGRLMRIAAEKPLAGEEPLSAEQPIGGAHPANSVTELKLTHAGTTDGTLRQ